MDFLNNIDFNLLTAIIILLVIVAAGILTRIVRWLITRAFTTASDKIKVDPTRYKFFKNAVSLIIWLVALGIIVSLIPELRALAITLFAGAGILVAILGFGAQQALANIASGIFIVIFKPFRVNDQISLGPEREGFVEDITLRHTVIRDFQNRRIIIPNSAISSDTVLNYSIDDPKICRHIEFSISYDSDIDLAKKIISEECLAHPNCIDNRTPEQLALGDPQVWVRVVRLDQFSINIRAWVWAADQGSSFRMHCDLNESVKKRFDREGVEIPFPYKTIVFKKDLPSNRKLES